SRVAFIRSPPSSLSGWQSAWDPLPRPGKSCGGSIARAETEDQANPPTLVQEESVIPVGTGIHLNPLLHWPTEPTLSTSARRVLCASWRTRRELSLAASVGFAATWGRGQTAEDGMAGPYH